MLARRTAFGDFSPGSGRRQCVSIAKSTGERCKRDAVNGADHCRTHRGVRTALARLKRRLGDKAQRVDNGAQARRALCAIVFQGAPGGLKLERNGRGAPSLGRLFEAYRNRASAPDEYQKALSNCLK
jgi:hypothetical protein